jgi:hypothetical protein
MVLIDSANLLFCGLMTVLVDVNNALQDHLLFVKLLPKEFEFIGNTVSVTAITMSKQVMAVVVDLVPLFVGGIIHNEALLFQTLPNVAIKLLEPILQFRVAISIPVQLIDRVDEIVERGAIRKSLQQSLEGN